jgi:hypothetical protein
VDRSHSPVPNTREIKMKSNFIEDNKKDWANEFADFLKIEYTSNQDEIVKMAAYTILYKIADEFKDGEFRKEILEQFKIV